MKTPEYHIDICGYLSACLGPADDGSSWRNLGEAVLSVPGVRGVLLAAWDEEGGPPVALGSLPRPAEELAALARGVPWARRREGAPPSAAREILPGVLAAALGDAAQPQGVALVSLDEAEARLTCVVEGVAAGLSVAVRRRQVERDILRLQDSLNERMAQMGDSAVGQLAASVAHELRNPLSSIKGAAQYLRNEYHDQVTMREFLDIILEEVGVLARITTEFLDFARPMHLNLKEGHLHDNIRKLLQVMKPQMAGQGIEAVVDLAPDVPPSTFDTQQIDHVLRNLVLNAVQAMPHGGALMVRTRTVSAPLPGIEVSISDTGRGIPPEDLDKLFTPFFTTKAKGVGLGLTIVQKIMENHGGSVSVESKPGSGSTFTIRLPGAPGAENLRVGR
ncbi:MAG: hypothetical protein HY321_10230 [Armatimonadetes bacterium]|nr:hypothetical protein [Armatimonadota bacterium]